MYKKLFTAICLIIFLTGGLSLNAQETDSADIVKQKLIKKEMRKAEKKSARKEMNSHFLIQVKTTYAFLQTQMRFTTPQGLLSFQVGLEKNLGMDDRSWLVSGNFIYRITPRSGLFGMYYGLNRKSTYTLKEDIIFPHDTIKAGSYIAPSFSTYVFSFGYLLSILDTKESFLGVFFNVYMMDIKTQIETNLTTRRPLNYKFLAPLPNFGLVMDFKFAKWFRLYGGVGIFFVNNIEGVGGAVYDMQVYATFMPTKWLGLSIGFQGFNLNVKEKLEDDFQMNITYNIKGPSAGVSFIF